MRVRGNSPVMRVRESPAMARSIDIDILSHGGGVVQCLHNYRKMYANLTEKMDPVFEVFERECSLA